MSSKYLIILTALLFTAGPLAAQVSYGDRSGYVPPRTERPKPPPPAASQNANQQSVTTTGGTVLDFPADDEQVIFYESTEQTLPPRVQPADLPSQGISQAEVRARFGNPVRSFPPVGNPPITRWDYKDFRVFFEYNLVLHAVIPGEFPPIRNRDELLSGG